MLGPRGSCVSRWSKSARLRSTQASTAAQGYVICVRLLAFLSSQLLQSLLALPLPSTPSDLNADGRKTHPRMSGCNPQQELGFVAPNARLREVYIPGVSFQHAMEASSTMLHLGNSRIDEMEDLLDIPPRYGREDETSSDGSQRMEINQQLDQSQSSPKQSLPAQFVASIWKDEASSDGNSPQVFMLRCQAAIAGLAKIPC